MTSRKSETNPDEELDRLLARGKLGGPARERVLDRVLHDVAPEKPPSRIWPRAVVLLSLAASVVLFFWFRGARTSRPEGGDGFTAKGGEGGGSLRAEAVCVGRDAERCAVGSTLALRLEGLPSGGRVIAFATRDRSRDRIWYFPTADGSTPEVVAGEGPQLVGRGVRIGAEHEPGRYTIHVLIARRALGREAALAPDNADVIARAEAPLEIEP